MKDDQDKLIEGHEYDGIQELDNHLPLWWLWTFFITIGFGFIYWIHYDVSGAGPTLDQELSAGMAQIEELRKKSESSAGDGKAVDPSVVLANGGNVYKNYCSSCHGANGEGGVGPNLADNYWIHGKESETIVKLIEVGVLAKGMPAWKGMIKPNDIQAVTQFILSLVGTNPPGGKGPEGELIE